MRVLKHLYDILFLNFFIKKFFFFPKIYAFIFLHSFLFKVNWSPIFANPPTNQNTFLKDLRIFIVEAKLVALESFINVIFLFLKTISCLYFNALKLFIILIIFFIFKFNCELIEKINDKFSLFPSDKKYGFVIFLSMF